MKQSEAMQHVYHMLWAVQKWRSNLTDPLLGMGELDDAAQRAVAYVNPYLWGEQNLLPPLQAIIAHYEATNELFPMDFFNLVTVATRLERGILLLAQLPFFEPDITWMAGWEPETA